jgi:putative ABC transport system permease protein
MRLTELRAALRAVRRAPTIPALVTLLAATGLGFALAMWAMVDALYFRPLPYPNADHLVTIIERHPERGRMAVPPGNFLDWSRSLGSFSVVSGSQWIEVSLNRETGAQRLTGARVLPAYFDVWGLPALAGRSLESRDYENDALVAVVSERVWRQGLGADPHAIGSSIRIDGLAHTLVGVMPAASSAIGRVDVWVPWVLTPEERAERRYHLVTAIGRLRADRSAVQASAELDAQYELLGSRHPETTGDWQGEVVGLRGDLIRTPAGAVASMAAVVVLTVAVCCLNVGALLAAWWSGRRQELLTRLALGAARAQLVRQLVSEAVVVAAAGVLGAAIVAHTCLRLLAALTVDSAAAFDIEPRLDARVAIVGAGVFAAFVVASALVPARRVVWSASRAVEDPRSTRRIGGRTSMVAQVAVTLLVAVIASALVDNVRALTRLGQADARRQQAIEIVLPDARYAEEWSQLAFFQRLLAALRLQPELASVAASSYVPPTQAPGNLRFTIDGRTGSSDAHSASPAAVDPEAFRSLGVALLRGRLIDERDGPGRPDVCVISAALARRYWGGSDPLGARLRVVGLDRPLTIVGVVSDVRQPISADPRAETVLYLPFAQVPWSFMTVMVEPSGGAAAAVAAVGRELARIDDGIAPGSPRPLDDVQRDWLRAPRLHATAVAAFGTITLMLTLAGIYARMAYRVAQRRREWAVRQALGATPARLRWTAIADVAAVTAAGALAGLALLPAAASLVAGMVYGADVLDWPRAALVASGLCLAAMAASDGPLRRIARLELARVLRQE